MDTKKYFYEYEDYEDGSKGVETMADEILNDPELSNVDEIVVGCWGECYDNTAQGIIDVFVEHKDKFSHVKSIFIGDMDYEECEVSWIEQGDYSRIWEALPNLEKLTIKGSTELELGNIEHNNLKSLEIICGGLPVSVIEQIADAKLPKLEKLSLYIGVESYGFEGGMKDLDNLIENIVNLKNLKYLGLEDSEIQDEIVQKVMESEILKQLEVLSFANGTLSDVGGQAILDNKDKLLHLKKLDLHYHFMSDEMIDKLNNIGIEIDLSDQNENDEKYGNYPMLTE